MKLTPDPFNKIANGEKIIESRLYDNKRQLIEVGDRIEFTNTEAPSKKISATVTALYRYPTFSELFSNFPPSHFGRKSTDALLKEINTFYSQEDQQKFGVVGIKLEIIHT